MTETSTPPLPVLRVVAAVRTHLAVPLLIRLRERAAPHFRVPEDWDHQVPEMVESGTGAPSWLGPRQDDVLAASLLVTRRPNSVRLDIKIVGGYGTMRPIGPGRFGLSLESGSAADHQSLADALVEQLRAMALDLCVGIDPGAATGEPCAAAFIQTVAANDSPPPAVAGAAGAKPAGEARRDAQVHFLPSPLAGQRDLGEISSITHVHMPDLIGYVERPETTPEWQWIEANASFRAVGNRVDPGLFEFILNLANDFDDPPPPLLVKAELDIARAASASYVLFYQ